MRRLFFAHHIPGHHHFQCDPADFQLPVSASLCPRVLSRMTCDRPGVLRSDHFLEQSSTHDPQAAAAAKSLQSCPTLCDPIDGSPPGSAVPGIFQARTLEELRFVSSLWDEISVRPVFALLPRMSMWYFQSPMGATSSWMQALLTVFPFLPRVSTLNVSCTSQRKSSHANSHLRVYFWKKSISEHFYLWHLIWPIQQFWKVQSYINQELGRNVDPIFCFLFCFVFLCIPRIAPGMLQMLNK